MDGLVCVFDVSQPTETSALREVFNVESSVSRFGFFGARAEGVYALTRTEEFSLFDTASTRRVAAYHNDLVRGTGLRERLGVDYFVDCLFEPRGQRLVLVGGTFAGDAAGFLVDVDGCTSLGPLARTDAARGHDDVVRCVDWFDGGPGVGWALITGGEDGRLTIWTAQAPA